MNLEEELILEVCSPLHPGEGPERWVAVSIKQTDDKLDLRCRYFNELGEKGGQSRHGADLSSTWLPGSLERVRTVRIAGHLNNGEIVLPESMRSYRIGTWIITQSVLWSQKWPDHYVHPIMLSRVDATPDNLERRNRLWQAFGFRFEDENPIDGYSLPMRVEEFRLPDKWRENITAVALDRFQDQCRYEISQMQREINSVSRKLQDHNEAFFWLHRNAGRFALLGGFLRSCNPPVRKREYEKETPRNRLPDSFPANAADTLKAYLPVRAELHYRLSSLQRAIKNIEDELFEIRRAPFRHLVRTIYESYTVRAVAVFAAIVLMICLAIAV